MVWPLNYKHYFKNKLLEIWYLIVEIWDMILMKFDCRNSIYSRKVVETEEIPYGGWCVLLSVHNIYMVSWGIV